MKGTLGCGSNSLARGMQCRRVLARERRQHIFDAGACPQQIAQQRPHHSGMAQVDLHVRVSNHPGRAHRQLENLDIGAKIGITVDLGTDLHRLAAGQRMHWPSVQGRSCVAKTRHTGTVKNVRIDARHLWRGIGAQTQRTAAELIDQFEGGKTQSWPLPVSSDSRCSSNGGITSS